MSEAPALDPIARNLGREIRHVREASGTSMRTLAARCGISQAFLSAVERGLSMPSIATLYRIANALDMAPAALLPAAAPGDVHVVRAAEGRRVAASERPRSAIGRLVFSDDGRGLEVYEYRTDITEDLDVWFSHGGQKVLYVVEGRIAVDFEDRPPEHLGPGDCLIHTGTIPHRWVVEEEGPVRLFLVVSRPVVA